MWILDNNEVNINSNFISLVVRDYYYAFTAKLYNIFSILVMITHIIITFLSLNLLIRVLLICIFSMSVPLNIVNLVLIILQ